jgi:hypothetical protein
MLYAQRGAGSRELPPVAAMLALAEGRHGLVGAARLGLRVRDLFLLALAALELARDALLDGGDHGLVHVFLFQLLVQRAALVRLHLVVRHRDKFLGGYVAR